MTSPMPSMTKELRPYIEKSSRDKPDISWARKANGHDKPWMADEYKGQWEGDPDETPPQGWLVKGIVPKLGVGLMAGQSGMGKTFAVLDLVQCLILQRDFAGKPVDQVGGVLLFAAEAPGASPQALGGTTQGQDCAVVLRNRRGYEAAAIQVDHQRATPVCGRCLRQDV